MKKIILTLIALMMLGSLLVAQDVFKKKSNTKDYDVWGYIYYWDGHHWVTGNPGPYLTLEWYSSRAYYNHHPNNPSVIGYPEIESNGFYHYTFTGPVYWGVDYGVIRLTIMSYQKDFDFDGSLNVDIYIPNPDAPTPVPDNTIPAEQ